MNFFIQYNPTSILICKTYLLEQTSTPKYLVVGGNWTKSGGNTFNSGYGELRLQIGN